MITIRIKEKNGKVHHTTKRDNPSGLEESLYFMMMTSALEGQGLDVRKMLSADTPLNEVFKMASDFNAKRNREGFTVVEGGNDN